MKSYQKKSAQLRASIRARVTTMMKDLLNPHSMNAKATRVAHVMAELRDNYGYGNVKREDIQREVEKYVEELIRSRPRRRRCAMYL